MSSQEKKNTTQSSLPQGVKTCIAASQNKLAENIIVLDLHQISSFTDYFIITNGNSNKQNAAICEAVEMDLKQENIRPLSIEGKQNAEWILMDYGDFILHIFSEKAREYYALEKLWGDGVKLEY